MEKVSQCDRVLDYIEQFGSITTFDAFKDLGILRLASRIHDLTKRGYVIIKSVETVRNRFGEKTNITRYSFGGN